MKMHTKYHITTCTPETSRRGRGRGGTALLPLFALFALFALLPGLTGCSAIKKAEAAKELEIHNPALETIADGTYSGSYDAGLTKVELETTVADGRIVGIEILKHDNGKGEKAERIVDEVIREQSLEVDVIAGATISSKSILKAAERSLRAGM